MERDVEGCEEPDHAGAILPSWSQSVSGKLKTAFRLWRAGFWRLLPASIVWGVLYVALPLLLQPSLASRMAEAPSTDEGTLAESGYLLAAVHVVGLVLASTWPGAVLTRELFDTGRAAWPRTRSALVVGTRRLPVVFGTTLLVFPSLVVGGIALVVPGLFLLGLLAVSPVVATLEPRGPVASIRESIRLARGQWEQAFGTAVAAFALAYGALVVASAVHGFISGLAVTVLRGSPEAVPPSEAGRVGLLFGLAGAPVTIVVGGLSFAFVVAAMLVLYRDLRLRKPARASGGDPSPRAGDARAVADEGEAGQRPGPELAGQRQ